MSETSVCDKNCFKVHIFHLDSYVTKPNKLHDVTYSQYRKSKVKQVTVLRIFGSTDNGIKTCLHLHRYFPHFSIRISEISNAYGCVDNRKRVQIDEEILDLFVCDLENEINKRLDRTEEYIYNIERYSAYSLYGYHDGEEEFIRVYFYCTWVMEKARHILEFGSINNYRFLCHSFLEFQLQFYIDNQIYLNEITLKRFSFRKKACYLEFENASQADDLFAMVGKEKLNSLTRLMQYNKLPATTACFLECDASIEDLVHIPIEPLFPQNTDYTPSHPGIRKLWNDQFERNKVDYDELIKCIQNRLKRSHHESNLAKIQLKLLENYINSESDTEMPFNSTRKSPIINNENLFDFDEIENEAGDDQEMSFTQQELNLVSDHVDHHVDFFDYYESDSAEEDCNEFDNIPQLDGMNDLHSKQNIVPIVYKNNIIKMDLNNLNDGYIYLPKISITQLMKCNNFVISANLKQKTLESNSKSPNSSKVSNSEGNQSLYSFYSSLDEYHLFHSSPLSSSNHRQFYTQANLVSPATHDFTHLMKKKFLHSTPDFYKQKRLSSVLSKDNKKFRTNLFCKTHEESLPPNKNEKVNLFVLSQDVNNKSSKMHYNDMSSIISSDTKAETLDQITIKISKQYKWFKCLEMTAMNLELHNQCRANLKANPAIDSIQMAFFSVYNEVIREDRIINASHKSDQDRQTLDLFYLGAIVVKPDSKLEQEEEFLYPSKSVYIDYVSSEVELLMRIAYYVKNFDPDIILGYMIDTDSWGYLLQRAAVLGIDIMSSLSRLTDAKEIKNNFIGAKNDPPRLLGRIVLNCWKLIRKEINLRSYTFENVYYHVFHERISKYHYIYVEALWQRSNTKNDPLCRHLFLDYYFKRVIGLFKILTRFNLIRRTYDLSCLFGMKFEDVINRGSQFRVESMLLPLCKLHGFVPIRFSKEFVSEQKRPQVIPLILEPSTAFHPEPVAILDFQSLYPSVMIAHNYCYSTCLGKVTNIIRNDSKFGCFRLKTDRQILDKLLDLIHISPNGTAFVKSHVRRGLLPMLLENLLFTRILVKNEIKKVDKRLLGEELSTGTRRELRHLKRLLDVLQLGLKLISNVTYGYTSANFSGRMPCVDIADSIVSKGREALERAVLLINQWGVKSGTGAKVVYGDTDSVFVSFPGASRGEAFKMAAFLTQEVTRNNPHPMAIKLEKVYQPCLLLSKKHYCGYAFESPGQVDPKFDAKGIETVRRDNCPATAKIVEKCIKILFDSKGNVDQARSYIEWQIKKILNGRLSNLSDFIFAKEFAGFEAYCNESVIPSCIVARRRLQVDPMDEPKYKERVAYVVVDGAPQDRLADLVRLPNELLTNSELKLNGPYYTKRALFPALARILEAFPNFTESDLFSWYDKARHMRAARMLQHRIGSKSELKVHLAPTCAFCGKAVATECPGTGDKTEPKLCQRCLEPGHDSAIIIKHHLNIATRRLTQSMQTCTHCCGVDIRMLSWLVDDQDDRHQCCVTTCPHLYRYQQSAFDFHYLFTLDKAVSILD